MSSSLWRWTGARRLTRLEGSGATSTTIRFTPPLPSRHRSGITKSTACTALTIAAPIGATDFTRTASTAPSRPCKIFRSTMHSRIYKGWVEHRRTAPREHRFRYRLFMLYLDLAELPGLFDGTPFWSSAKPALAWLKRSDYLGPPELSLDEAVRCLVAQRTGRRPQGAIRLLTHLRYFGIRMNPVSFYYCFDAAGGKLETIVAEITNTPWDERHQYVLEVDAAHGRLKRFEFDKAFHVSPFLPMDMRYEWSFNQPAQ